MGTTAKEPWETERRGEFRERFGEDPEAYDRTRPVLPSVVLDDLVQLADVHPGSDVVEIGPGTGQATHLLAERGLRVLALEIDPRLAARAAENLAGSPLVAVRTISFEEWDPGPATFDVVFACNAFHWVDPDIRFVKAAAVLKPHGHLAVVVTPVVVPDDASRFWWDVQDDWDAVGSERLDPATRHPDLVADLGPEVRASGLFEEPRTTRHRFDVTFSTEEYVANLSTQSGVKGLSPEARVEFLERVQRRVDSHGGTVVVHHLAVLTVAERAG